MPGVLALATDEAAIFFPPEIADEVIARAAKHRDEENYERELVRNKKYKFRDA